MSDYAPATVSEAYREYAHKLLQYHRLLSAGKEQAAETESVEDEMTAVWHQMDAAERRSLSGLGSDLSWVRRGCQMAPRGRRPEEVTPQDLQALLNARADADWHALLHHLRVCSAKLPPFQVAYLRASAWTAIGFPDIASVFYDLAAELEPSNGAIAVLALRTSAEVDSMAALERARRITQDPFRYPAVVVSLAAAMLLGGTGPNKSSLDSHAVDLLRETLERLRLEPVSESERAMTYQLAASALDSLDQPEEAMKYYEQALRIAPNNREVLVGLGLLLYGRNTDRAVQLFRDAAGRQYPLVWPYLFLAHYSLLSKEFDQALAYCTQAWSRATTNQVRAELLEWSAICQSELAFPDAAVRAMFEKAIELDPANERFAKNLRAFDQARRTSAQLEYEIQSWESLKVGHGGQAAPQQAWPTIERLEAQGVLA